MERKKTKKPFAKKSFGQNFLVDKNYIEKIISALNPQKNETIIEIGPGRGALTEMLLESGAAVTAIELERDMIAVLKDKFENFENFKLVEQDALKIDFAELINPRSEIPNPRSQIRNPQSARLVANLPYYISTAILQKLIEQRASLSEMILMFQLEVVDRITAGVGNRERGFLTVLVEAFLETEKLFEVPPNAFRPPPKVRSAVVRLKPKPESDIRDEKLFRELISAAFMQKRKTILNNLKSAPPSLRARIGEPEDLLERAEVPPGRRAESLTLAEWKQICSVLA
jgi:16S rRNA (adenine1518-N6/adenine1519-N6)-dimethyltransferase